MCGAESAGAGGSKDMNAMGTAGMPGLVWKLTFSSGAVEYVETAEQALLMVAITDNGKLMRAQRIPVGNIRGKRNDPRPPGATWLLTFRAGDGPEVAVTIPPVRYGEPQLFRQTHETLSAYHVGQAVRDLEQAKLAAEGRDAEALEEILVWLRLSRKCLKERLDAWAKAEAEKTVRTHWNERIAAETGKANG